MVKEIRGFTCECHGIFFESKEEAEEHEKENSKCYYCGVPVEDIEDVK